MVTDDLNERFGNSWSMGNLCCAALLLIYCTIHSESQILGIFSLINFFQRIIFWPILGISAAIEHFILLVLIVFLVLCLAE